MNRTMITATNTLGQLQKNLDVISSNIGQCRYGQDISEKSHLYRLACAAI